VREHHACHNQERGSMLNSTGAREALTDHGSIEGCLRDQLTISIVSHGHGPLVVQLLRDLDDLPSLRGVTVVVTLNLPDEILDISPFQNLRIKIRRNLASIGFSANHNHAFGLCTTPWFAVLNPDLRISSSIFEQLIVEAAGDDGIALVAPRVMNSKGNTEDSVRRNLTPWSVISRRMRHVDSIVASDTGAFRWYAGMFFLIRSAAYAQVKGFDERYFLYCEDYDLCARLHLKSLKIVYAESICVVHDAQRHSHKSIRYSWFHLKSMMRVWLSAPVWRIALRDVTSHLLRSSGRYKNLFKNYA
jgi:N-acetylglucosaminyl-diphospho-decaprenol L-rhamnosyltransferase